jgi:hypothetical protein
MLLKSISNKLYKDVYNCGGISDCFGVFWRGRVTCVADTLVGDFMQLQFLSLVAVLTGSTNPQLSPRYIYSPCRVLGVVGHLANFVIPSLRFLSMPYDIAVCEMVFCRTIWFGTAERYTTGL